QGRFGEFRWPTDNGFTGTWAQLLSNPAERDNFDNSEYMAWQSAQGLLNKLNDLNVEYPGHVYMLAHSLGNVVAGEALRLAGTNQVVNTYVASQAAISAHTYDSTITSPYLLQFTYQYPTGPLNSLGTLNYGPSTPNIYGNWLAENSVAVGKRINFYNINDYALAMPAWGYDQITKPDSSVLEGVRFWTYGYNGSAGDPPPWNNFHKENDLGFDISFDIVNVLTNRYEVMSYAAESYSTALGATPTVTTLTRNVDMTSPDNNIWPSPDPLGNSYKSHFWHSAEFEGDNAMMQGYWNYLLSSQAFSLK
ncbi:MAG: hypothetical protein ACREFR_19825, partial [Limisphaerales bacterium]